MATYLINLLKTEKTEPLTRVELFKIINNISDAEFSYLHLLKHLKKPTLGNIKMPNGTIKMIKII